MTWDERGRLWVVELYEYPLGAPPGRKPRDRIKILEDTDGDGRADMVTVFADGLNLATGLLLGNGGAYVGQAPDFLFLKDENGDDISDSRVAILSGFGLEDRHELLNGFTWGPDGWLYMTQGVFTYSKVRDPLKPDDDNVSMNAAVARFHPRTRKFEVFADGTSNPWGVDFDRAGNAFVSACVIDHLFHLAPGGLYVRQSGTPTHPYAYQLIPSIVDHKHFRAAYAGVQIYQGNQYPAEYLGTIFMGNIHDSAVHQDRLAANGSTFKASFEKDFLRANDGWFRPVSTQTGPDGALWIMDWYDKYPCYQNARADPEGVDRELGRIWRVVHVGDKAGAPVSSRPSRDMNLAKLSTAELVTTLAHPNIWHRKMAQRLLNERRDPAAKPLLQKLLAEGKSLEGRLFALWTLHGSDQLDESVLDQYTRDAETAIRTWVARLTGERHSLAESALKRLAQLAPDKEAPVRLAVATALRQYASGSLTVNTPAPASPPEGVVGEILAQLIASSADGKDPVIPFMIWHAAEPTAAGNPEPYLKWLSENGPSTLPLSGQLARKFMRRLCDTRQPEKLDRAVNFLATIADKDPALMIAALEGLVEGERGKAIVPTLDTGPVLASLASNPNAVVRDRSRELGTLWGNNAATRATIALVTNAKAGIEERLKAIQSLRQLKNDAAREAMLQLLAPGSGDALTIEAIRALGDIGGDAAADEFIGKWKTFSAAARRAASDVLVTRGRWASKLLSALESKMIPPADIPATSIRTLMQSKDDYGMLARRATLVFGRVREADRDKLKIIAQKRKMVMEGPVDIKSGHEVAQRTCFTCHKLHGEGAEVGPDLTGVGRSTLDALLANVIDPNQIIGAGYENVEVETKDARSVNGRMVENSNARVRLISAGGKEDVIARSDIQNLRVSELSVMPEGLEQLPDAEFRNLIWFILCPPQDGRPFSEELRKEMGGAAGGGKSR